MKIIVCGCGKIGMAVLEALTAEGHDVIALDNKPEVVAAAANVCDVMGVCGNCADCETLESAGVKQAELFIAVTDYDEVNMLACFLARRMGAAHTIARIRNPEYNDASLDFMKRELGLSMAINPEQLAARELFDMLRVPSAAKIETFNGRSFEMIELVLREGSPLDNLSLMELRAKYKAKVLVCIVQRGEQVFVPRGEFVLKDGDRIAITATPDEIDKFLRQTELYRKQARNIMVLGGSKTAYYLAKMLENGSGEVKIIERNPAVSEEFSESLPEATVITGDGAQQELLLEEGIKSVDAFVALTGTDEQNILISIYASSQGVPKVITKVNRSEFVDMAEKLGLDGIITPKKLIADMMVQYARALENSKGAAVETMYKLMDGKVEALEFVANAKSNIIGVPLIKLRLKQNILIAGIIRGRKTIVPSGSDEILAGDHVIVLAGEQRLSDLTDILQ